MTKVVVVSGAAGGIGGAVVRNRASRGDIVFGLDRDVEGLARLKHALPELRFFPVQADLTLEASDEWLHTRLPKAVHGDPRLDAVVHCAGIGGWKPFSDMEAADWDAMMHTNAGGPLRLTRSLLPHLRREIATIAHISSDAALGPFPKRTAYCASKAALAAAFDVIREELRPAGIRVSTIYCNRVDTAFNGGVAGNRPEALQPDDVARAVDMLIELRSGVEIREVHLAAQHSPFGA